jgi:hypothetical protein
MLLDQEVLSAVAEEVDLPVVEEVEDLLILILMILVFGFLPVDLVAVETLLLD